MRSPEPQYAIVESREGAEFLGEGAELPPAFAVVRLVDESKFDWEMDGLVEDAVTFTARSRSRLKAFEDLQNFANGELGIKLSSLTVKRLNGEILSQAADLGFLAPE